MFKVEDIAKGHIESMARELAKITEAYNTAIGQKAILECKLKSATETLELIATPLEEASMEHKFDKGLALTELERIKQA